MFFRCAKRGQAQRCQLILYIAKIELAQRHIVNQIPRAGLIIRMHGLEVTGEARLQLDAALANRVQLLQKFTEIRAQMSLPVEWLRCAVQI